MFKEVENFITAAECKDLIALYNQIVPAPAEYLTNHRLVSKDDPNYIYNYRVNQLDRNRPCDGELEIDSRYDEKVLKALYCQLPNVHPINQRLWITSCDWAKENNYSINAGSGSAIQKYEIGGHYGWHVDGFNETDRFSLSIQLSDSDDYEGCNVEFGEDLQGSNRTTGQDIYHDWDLTQRSVKPVYTLSRNIGTMCLYDAFIYHRVTPVTKGTRYVLLHWFRYFPEFKEDKITWSDG